MKNKLFIFILCFSTLIAMGQTRQVNSLSTTKKISVAKVHTPNQQNRTKTDNAKKGFVNGHEWIDLGLPSGTKWATTNVGAASPSHYGNYYAWGEISTKSAYDEENYKYYQSSEGNEGYLKYVTDSEYGKVDKKNELDSNDDVASVSWGKGWCMPSKDQIEELIKKCKWTHFTMGDHNGFKVQGPNGNFIFLPMAGTYVDDVYEPGFQGGYWSRSLSTSQNSDAYILLLCELCDDSVMFEEVSRDMGESVRPVLK